MKICYAFFASARYWTDLNELQETYCKICEQLVPKQAESFLITGQDCAYKGDILVVVPMSGAVQQNILQTAANFQHVVLYAGYTAGNTFPAAEKNMLLRNAAPTLMDCWGVLRRTHPSIQLATNRESLQEILEICEAAEKIKGAKLLLIGETEPWVVSVSRDFERYAALGIIIEQIPQPELAKRYEITSFEECQEIYRHFTENAKIEEPDEQDLQNACRMAKALMDTLSAHHADGAAVACFNLLQTGTTCCLGVSYLNDQTQTPVACEGDLDSALTMLILKRIGIKRVWMANPALCPGKSIQFSHCTGPVWSEKGWILRNHHESGIGVSIQSPLPQGIVTACRVSAETGSVTIQAGKSREGERLPVCRSQMYVDFESPERYLETALGCHQVFAFEDCMWKMENFSKMIGLRID